MKLKLLCTHIAIYYYLNLNMFLFILIVTPSHNSYNSTKKGIFVCFIQKHII